MRHNNIFSDIIRRTAVMLIVMLLTAATAWAGEKPVACLDVCRGEANNIYVSGWAYDPDKRDWGLSVKVYVYTDPTCQNQYADKGLSTGDDRPDVVTAHNLPSGSKPGFQGRIAIKDPGIYYIKVYAIDIDSEGEDVANSSTLIDDTFSSVTVTTLTTISSAADWNAFAIAIQTGGEDYTGKTVTLTADIPTAEEIAAGVTAITTTTSESKAFCGTFDGQGHTINVDLNNSGANANGLFCNVKGATFKNLTVTGAIQNSGSYTGGLIGTAKGVTIKNCNLAATITTSNSNAEIGAFVGACSKIDANTPGYLTLQDCVFSGAIHATGAYSSNCKAAGLASVWHNASLTIVDCLVKGTFTSERAGAQFYPMAFKDDAASVTATVCGAYYLNTLSATTSGSNVIAGTLGTVVSTTETETYDYPVTLSDGNRYYVSPVPLVSTTEWTEGNVYKLNSNLTIDSRVNVNGNVVLYLGEGYTLTVPKGIELPYGSWLTIEGSGTLHVTSPDNNRAGIGAYDGGTLVVNSGHINARGGINGAGIGGSRRVNYSSNAPVDHGLNVIINGGQVTAVGGERAYGFGHGGGNSSSAGHGGSMVINYSEVSDFIDASGGAGGFSDGFETVTIAAGKTFLIYGTATIATPSNIRGNCKLIPKVPAMDFDMTYAVVSGISEGYAYYFTGQAIPVNYSLTDVNANALTEGTDYTATLTSEGSPAEAVFGVGSYTYTFTGMGKYSGTHTVNFTVTIPPKPTELTQTAYTASTATLAWKENGAATNWTLQYSTDYTFNTYTEVAVSTDPMTTISDLTPEQMYYYRVKSVIGQESSRWSAAQPFLSTTKGYLQLTLDFTTQEAVSANYTVPISPTMYTMLTGMEDYHYVVDVDNGSSTLDRNLLDLDYNGKANVILTATGEGDETTYSARFDQSQSYMYDNDILLSMSNNENMPPIVVLFKFDDDNSTKEPIEYYPVWLFGKRLQLTSKNKDDVHCEGYVYREDACFNASYDPVTKTLTLSGQGADIDEYDDDDSPLITSWLDLTLAGNLTMQCRDADYNLYNCDFKIPTVVRCGGMLTIAGDFTLFSMDNTIMALGGITLRSGRLAASSYRGIPLYYQVGGFHMESGFEKLELLTSRGAYALIGFEQNSLTIPDGFTVMKPTNWNYVPGHSAIGEVDSNTNALYLVIARNDKTELPDRELVVRYPVWIGQQQLTPFYIRSQGYVSHNGYYNGDRYTEYEYDYSTHTLTLGFMEDHWLTESRYGTYRGALIYAEMEDLTIKGNYPMDNASSDYAILTADNCTLTLDGDFTFKGNNTGIYTHGNDVVVKSGTQKIGGAVGIECGNLTVLEDVNYIEALGTKDAYRTSELTLPQDYIVTDYKALYNLDVALSIIQNKNNANLYIPAGIPFPLWLGNTNVNTNNYNDILNDGGKAKFDPINYTLTLDEPVITGADDYKIIKGKMPLVLTGKYHMTEADVKYGLLSSSVGPITIRGDFKFLGKQVGLFNNQDKTILDWATPDDKLYIGGVQIKKWDDIVFEKAFIGYLDDSRSFYVDNDNKTALVHRTIYPVLMLYDNCDNSDAIASVDNQCIAVFLKDRQLYRDDDWNTLCLPFNVNTSSGLISRAVIKELDAETSNLDSNGTLTLNFKDATSIEAGKPYIIKWKIADVHIKTAADWNAFAQSVNNGNTYAGKTVRLMKNISVSTMVGTDSHPFSGIFDGAGHTLNVTINASSTAYAAPFRVIGGGATIKNLTVIGNVVGGIHCAGLVGHVEGSGVENIIWLCDVRTNINCRSTHCGGVMGHGGGSKTSIWDTRFVGSITGENLTNIGVFWGWSDGDSEPFLECNLAAGAYTSIEGIDMGRAAGQPAVQGNIGYKTQNFGKLGTYTTATGNDLASLLGEYWTVSNGVVVPIIDPDTPSEVLTNVSFPNKTIDASASTTVDFSGGSFVGTYSPVGLPVNDQSNLFLGAENKLFWPNAANNEDGKYYINSCRAYFHIGNAANVREIVLNIDDETTGIVEAEANSSLFTLRSSLSGAIYNLAGQRLNRLQKGINIVNGKKVVIR